MKTIRRSFLIASLAMAFQGVALAVPPQEQSRIERLLKYIETRKDMKFIRNGSEYTCEEAAKFLRGKLESMGGEVVTARQFIEQIASRSSMSGKPYQVRLADGSLVLAGQFLSDELARIERQPA